MSKCQTRSAEVLDKERKTVLEEKIAAKEKLQSLSEDLSLEDLSAVAGGGRGDVRTDVFEDCADAAYVSGLLNDVDGWA